MQGMVWAYRGNIQPWAACFAAATAKLRALPPWGALSMADTFRISKTCLPGELYPIYYLFFQQTSLKQGFCGPGFPDFLWGMKMFLLQGPVSAGNDLDFFDTHLKIHAGPPACSPHSAGNPDFAPPHWRASEHYWALNREQLLFSQALSEGSGKK